MDFDGTVDEDAAGLAVASVALSGCLYSLIPDTAPASTASPTADTEGVAPELLPFYGQDLEWETCADHFDCTMVTAPLDWANPAAGNIELSIIRRSPGPRSNRRDPSQHNIPERDVSLNSACPSRPAPS